MSIYIHVPGSPAECRRSARRLDRLADELGSATTLSSRLSHLPQDDFDGHAGIAFRDRASALASRTQKESERCRELSAALDSLASGLEDARSMMHRAWMEAHELLVVEDWSIRRPVGFDDAEQRAYQRAAHWADRAREREGQAQTDWQEALSRRTGTPAPLTLIAPVPGWGPHLGLGEHGAVFHVQPAAFHTQPAAFHTQPAAFHTQPASFTSGSVASQAGPSGGPHESGLLTSGSGPGPRSVEPRDTDFVEGHRGRD